jgi:3-isopropylmalate dehydrogenase
MPDGELERFRQQYDAIFLGALGDPRVPDMRHARDILLGARRTLDLFINLRPVKLWDSALCPLKGRQPGDIDVVIFRENTEGVYSGMGGCHRKGTPHEVAVTEMIATYHGTERIIRAAFEYARDNKRASVCMASKHNAIQHAHGLWARVFREVAADYADIESFELFGDVAAMELVRDPTRFSVIVTSNLLGDVLSDLAAQVVGGIGLAPSANVNPGRVSLFEPVHGSAPDIVGKSIANPIAAILTGAMLCKHLGEQSAARRIERAVEHAVADRAVTRDLGGTLNTQAATQAIIDRLDG